MLLLNRSTLLVICRDFPFTIRELSPCLNNGKEYLCTDSIKDKSSTFKKGKLEKCNKHQPSKTVKTMKRNEVMAIIATSLMLFALCLSASAKDRNEKVINYSTRIDDDNNRKPTVTVCPERPTPPTLGPAFCPEEGTRYGYSLSNQSFSILYNKVKKASFDDNKFDLIEVASLGCYYSCSQAVRLMKIFTFDDERLKALSMMAPHIVDPQNATDIYKLFSFDSDKEKAGEIMRKCK